MPALHVAVELVCMCMCVWVCVCVGGTNYISEIYKLMKLKYAHCFHDFPFSYHAEESYITQIEYGFDQHDVEIIDTAGQEEFMLFRDTSLSKGDGFLALFAINSLSSWYSLKQLRAKIVREHDDDETIPMVIVANKNVSV